MSILTKNEELGAKTQVARIRALRVFQKRRSYFASTERYRPPMNLIYGSSERARNSLQNLPLNFSSDYYRTSCHNLKTKNLVQVARIRALYGSL